MAGDEDDLLLPVGQTVQLFRGKAVIRPHRSLQRVDDRISRDEQPVGDALFDEVILIIDGRAEVEVRNGGHHFAVHLLGEGRIFVVSPEAGLHMAHLYLMVKGRQGTCKGGRGVAVDQDHVRLQFLDGLIHANEAFAGDGGKGLPGGHDVQVVIGLQGKDLQHGIQHLPVLGSDTAKALHLRAGSQFLDQRAHLNGFRPRAEYAHDTKLVHVMIPHLSRVPSGARAL